MFRKLTCTLGKSTVFAICVLEKPKIALCRDFRHSEDRFANLANNSKMPFPSEISPKLLITKKFKEILPFLRTLILRNRKKIAKSYSIYLRETFFLFELQEPDAPADASPRFLLKAVEHLSAIFADTLASAPSSSPPSEPVPEDKFKPVPGIEAAA